MIEATGSNLLVRLLESLGIDVVAGVPGGTVSTLAVEIGAAKEINHILVQNEAAAAFAADVYFRVSGRLMAIMLHSSPGVGNALTAISAAYLDSSSMLIIAGEVDRDLIGRGAIHDLSRGSDGEVAQLLGRVTKRTWQTHSALQIVEHVLRATKLAIVQRPGPVALSVFKDIWTERVEIPTWPSPVGYSVSARSAADPGEVERAVQLLANARRPMILAGNGVNISRARAGLRALAEKLQAPVATTSGGKGAFPEDHPLSVGVIGWVGTSSANWTGSNADVVLALGSRLSDSTTSGWQPGVSFDFSHTKLIHLDIDPEIIGNVYPADVALLGDAGATIDELIGRLDGPAALPDWRAEVERAKADWVQVVQECVEMPGDLLQIGYVVAALRAKTSGTPVNLVTDIGNHSSWLVQQFPAAADDIIITSMGAGTMGIAPSGAVGAALARPQARTVAWVGDGGMAMTSYVLPTLAQYRLPVTVIVLDNGGFSSVEKAMTRRLGSHAFARFDGSGSNPNYRIDFSMLANACGVEARRVTTQQELEDALEWALASDEPCLLDVIVDPLSNFPDGGGQRREQLWGHQLGSIYPWAPIEPTDESRTAEVS
jgi:acetolactate synthase I/II/III large subunit